MPIFHDPFLDNDNEWEIRDDHHAYLQIADNDYGYIFENHHRDQPWTTWQPLFIDEVIDYKIHAVIERLAGPSNGYGLIWRCQDEENCYSFEISHSSHYRIQRCDAGTWSTVRDWTQTDTIRGDKYPFNELLIQQFANKARFFINETCVEEMAFTEPPQGHGFGFIVNGFVQIRIISTIVLRHVEWTQTAASTTISNIDSDDVQAVLNELDALIGLNNIKQEVSTFVNFLKVQRMRQERGLATPSLSYHMVLSGPPGTGKTTVARLIGKIYQALGILNKGHVVETDRAGLVAPFVGQTALKVDAIVEKALGGILFIDEAYALMPKSGGSTQDFGQEAIESLLKRMEDQRGEFAVIIAGYENEMHRFLEANPGVKSRFNRYLYFSHYKPRELADMYDTMAHDNGLHLTHSAKDKLQHILDDACEMRDDSFGNGRYVRNLLEKSIEHQANRIVNITPMTDDILTTLTAADIQPIPN